MSSIIVGMAMFVIDDYRCVTSENCVMAKFAFWGSRENQLGSGYPSGCPGPLLCYNDGWGMRGNPPVAPSVVGSKHKSARIEPRFKGTTTHVNNA